MNSKIFGLGKCMKTFYDIVIVCRRRLKSKLAKLSWDTEWA